MGGAAYVAQVLSGSNRWLRHLDLGFNGVCAQGACALATGLRGNVVLETLELGYNGISDAGVQALAGAVQVNTVLTSLGLPSNGISDEGVNELVVALRDNRYMHVHNQVHEHTHTLSLS